MKSGVRKYVWSNERNSLRSLALNLSNVELDNLATMPMLYGEQHSGEVRSRFQLTSFLSSARSGTYCTVRRDRRSKRFSESHPGPLQFVCIKSESWPYPTIDVVAFMPAFQVAHDWIQSLRPSIFQVSISEGRELSRQYNTAFHEVSVADDPVDTITVMNRVIRELWIAKVCILKTYHDALWHSIRMSWFGPD